MKTEKQVQKTGHAPEKKFRAGAVSATVWKNEFTGQKGPASYFSISIERSYTDKDNKWQSTNSLRLNDLPRAALVIQKAYEYLVMKDKAASSPSSQEGGSIEMEDIY